MVSSEERLKILDMVRDGKISPEEGARLLQALQSGAKKGESSGREPRWLRVRVTDLATNRTKVSVNIPMGLVNVGMKMGARFVPSNANFDYQGIMEAIKSGETGKIVDYEDAAEAERVEVWIE